MLRNKQLHLLVHNHGIFGKKSNYCPCASENLKTDLSKAMYLHAYFFYTQIQAKVCLLSGLKQQGKTQYKYQHTKNERDGIQCKPLSS